MIKKMRNRKLGFLVYGFIFITLVLIMIISFKPIINPSPKNCNVVSGTIEQIWGCEDNHDINIQISEDDKTYYINRGLDSELRTYDLKCLLGKSVEMYTVKHWILLDPKSRINHVASLIIGGDTFYTEF